MILGHEFLTNQTRINIMGLIETEEEEVGFTYVCHFGGAAGTFLKTALETIFVMS